MSLRAVSEHTTARPDDPGAAAAPGPHTLARAPLPPAGAPLKGLRPTRLPLNT